MQQARQASGVAGQNAVSGPKQQTRMSTTRQVQAARRCCLRVSSWRVCAKAATDRSVTGKYPYHSQSPRSPWASQRRALGVSGICHSGTSQQLMDPNLGLHGAVADRDVDLVKLLLVEGADPCAKDEQGLTAIHYVEPALHCSKNRYDAGEAILERLLRSGGDINAQDHKGWTPLHHVAYMNLYTWRASRRISFWLSHGANAAAECAQGATALHIACQTSNVGVVEALVQHGAPLSFDANSACKGWMPMHCAADNLHPGVMKLLLKSCTPEALNAADVQDWTPLHVAVSPKTHIKEMVDWSWTKNLTKEWIHDHDSYTHEDMLWYEEALDNLHLHIVLQLLKGGADVKAAAAQGWSPLRCAMAAWKDPSSALATPQGGEPHQAHVQSTFQAYMRELEFRISDDAVCEGVNYHNYGRHGYLDLPLYIDEDGPLETRFARELHISDFRRDCRFQSGRRRFDQLEHSADLSADDLVEIALMKILLHHGADVEQADEMGWTALHYATAANCTRAMQLLVSAGADVNAQDGKGQTALFHAAQAQDLATVDVLLSLGAATNTAGQLPSVPFDTAQIENAVFALDHALQEQLSLTQSRISKAQEPVVTSYQNQRTVPKSLRIGWPSEALQFMQSVDELQAQILKQEQQHKDAMQALEVEFTQTMIQNQEKLRNLKL